MLQLEHKVKGDFDLVSFFDVRDIAKTSCRRRIRQEVLLPKYVNRRQQVRFEMRAMKRRQQASCLLHSEFIRVDRKQSHGQKQPGRSEGIRARSPPRDTRFDTVFTLPRTRVSPNESASDGAVP